jgi:hypothetical protein
MAQVFPDSPAGGGGMEIRFEGSLCYVLLAGEMNGRRAEQLYREVLRECVAGGRSRMLIDCRELSGELSTTDRYSLGKVVAEENAVAMAGGAQVRVAMVGRDPIVDRHRFGETVAINRGAAVKVTYDLESAYRWLGVDLPAQVPHVSPEPAVHS